MSALEHSVEQAAIRQLQEQGYHYVPGADLAEERAGTTTVLLEGRLRQAIARLNPHLSQDAREEVARRVLQPPTASVDENNRLFHQALTRGVPLEVRRDGETRGDLGRLIDFEEPDANDWLVTSQLTVRGAEQTSRPDLVIYLNGIPLAVFEIKSPDEPSATLESAWFQLHQYKTRIPILFDTNEVLVISDGSEARFGSLTAGFERFGPWKSIEGERPAPGTRSTLPILLAGLFDRRRFLDYLRSYVFWETDKGRVKKIAGYHQFFAVEKAVAATVERARTGKDRRIGVIWHTQGSGKSVSMVFYAGKVIREPALENPTLVVLTDRIDLDDQLFGQFAAAKDLLPKPVQAKDREHLRRLLGVQSGGVVFSTLHKLTPTKDEPRMPTLTERDNVIVIADEAHRSHYEFADGLAKNLRDALPNAMFLGFTGTPLELEDRSTSDVFGDYLDVYPMSQSVADKATVPIHYEGRQNKSYLLDNLAHEIDEKARQVSEALPETQRERLLREEASVTSILGNPRFLKAVAEDVVAHWDERQKVIEGKGFIATPSREIAALLYDQIVKLRPSWHSADDERGRVKVVMTGSAQDPPLLRRHVHDPRSLKTIERRFKDPDDPLALVIVVDMWLTGFDVPPAHTMYLYKSLKGHNLMQAVARVNRVWGDKPGGLIVDYVGVAAELEKAVGRYGGLAEERIAAPVEEQLRALDMWLGIVRDMFHGFDYQPFFDQPEIRPRILTAAENHLLDLSAANGKSGAERFREAMASLNKAAAMALHREEARDWREEVAFFQAVQRSLAKKLESGEDQRLRARDLGPYRAAIRMVVEGSIASEGVVDLFELQGLDKPELSILSEEFLEAIRRQPYENVQVELLRRLLEDEIRLRSRSHVVQARRFSEMLQESLNKYRNRSLSAAQVMLELIEVARHLREAPKKGEQMGLSEDELAFYEALADHEDVEDVMGVDALKIIAQEMVEKIRESVTIDWTQKEAVRAKLRAQVKRLLRRRGYPPDKQEKAVDTVLEQARSLCRDWASREEREKETPPPPRIVRDEEGVPWIAGANTKVVELVDHRESYDETPEEIHEALPHLSLEQIRLAFDFYEKHKAEIDEDLRRRREWVERLQEELGPPPFLDELR